MKATYLVFYPETYIGFNKTRLIERHLTAAGVIGAKFKSSSAFSVGQNFRQYVPKVDSIYKYQHGMVRIHIQSVGVWAKAAGRAAILECSNMVLVEGDSIGQPLERYSPLCELLFRITGDRYQVGVANEPIHFGVSDARVTYLVNLHTGPGNKVIMLSIAEDKYPADIRCHPLVDNGVLIE